MKKISILAKSMEILILLSKLKVVFLCPVLSSLPFPTFWKRNFMYFGRRHVETEPSHLH